MADKFNFRLQGAATTNEWLTPPHIIQELGEFDLDPCAPRKDVRLWNTAKKHYTGPRDLFDVSTDPERMCGLATPWAGRVWLNPPYGDETYPWLEKLAAHGNGTAMIFARTDTNGFHDHVWKKARAVFFFDTRISFYRVDGTQGTNAGAPSVLISYSDYDTQAIKVSKLSGCLVRLR